MRRPGGAALLLLLLLLLPAMEASRWMERPAHAASLGTLASK